MLLIFLLFVMLKPHIFKIDTERSSIFQVVLQPAQNALFSNQLDDLSYQYDNLLITLNLNENDLFFSKVFISDYLNQKEIIRKHPLFESKFSNCGLSVVEQPPLDSSKINILLLFVKGAAIQKKREGNLFYAKTNNHLHIFQGVECHAPATMLEKGTEDLFEQHQKLMNQFAMNMTDNCARTWLYVKDVDKDYEAVVRGRNTFFDRIGLTKETHFIASTGIGGSGESVEIPLYAEFYSVKDLRPEQIRYLTAKDYLNSTHEYGVAFERGVNISYADISCTFISGTASIDRHGDCLFQGDIVKQLERIFINIEQLLKDADAVMTDIGHLIVYLRDISDYHAVNSYLTANYGAIPYIITHAKVCRTQWLVEIECMALKKNKLNLPGN